VALWTVIAFLVLNFKSVQVRKSLLIMFLMYSIYLICTLERSREKIQAAFLDVGQGDAGCLIFPNRHLIIIDAGDKVGEWDSGQNTVLPYLKSVGNLHAQYAVLSHPHDDHIAGFYSLLQIVELDTLIISRYHYPSQIYSELLSLCRRRDIFIRYVEKGDCLYPDPSCRVYILHPDSSYTALTGNDGATCNNNSIVLKVQYGQNGILYLGDLQKEAEESILFYDNFLECEILKAAHHGAANATSVNLLNEVQPLCAVISVARKNKFNHPSPHTLDRLNDQRIRTYQTSQQGAVIFEIGMENIKKIDWR
jgi:competence protein ComEC